MKKKVKWNGTLQELINMNGALYCSLFQDVDHIYDVEDECDEFYYLTSECDGILGFVKERFDEVHMSEYKEKSLNEIIVEGVAASSENDFAMKKLRIQRLISNEGDTISISMLDQSNNPVVYIIPTAGIKELLQDDIRILLERI